MCNFNTFVRVKYKFNEYRNEKHRKLLNIIYYQIKTNSFIGDRINIIGNYEYLLCIIKRI